MSTQTPETPVARLARLLHADAETQRETSDIHENGPRTWDSLSVGEQRDYQARALVISDSLGGALSESFPDPVTHDGYDAAGTTPVGATITRVYFCEPGHGTGAADGEHDFYETALDAAITRHEAAAAQHREHYASTPDEHYLPLPERFSIDVRWTLTWDQDPSAGINSTGTDTVARRTTYATLDAGREHLARLRKYTYTPTRRDREFNVPGTRSSTVFERSGGNSYTTEDDGESSLDDVSTPPATIAPVEIAEASPTESGSTIARLDEQIEDARARREQSVGAEEYARHHNHIARLRAEREHLRASARPPEGTR